MKKIKNSIFFAFILILFSSCSLFQSDLPDDNNIKEDNETIKDESRMDKIVLDDYKNIEPSGDHDFFVMFVNVGKADTIILKIDELFYMIDTGTSESAPYTLAALENLGITRLESVFLTHPDRDHVGGYGFISEKCEIAATYCPSICNEMFVFEKTVADIIKLDPGSVIKAVNGVYFEILGPIKYNPLDDNDNSLIIRLQINGKTILFAGDMKAEEEKTLIAENMPLDCDVLKVGYHGRSDSTTDEFVSATSPEYSVICTSREDEKDTADKNVIMKLKNVGSEVFITEECGLGLVLIIGKDGKITTRNIYPKENHSEIEIKSVSKTDQTLILVNKGKNDVDISGWYVTSDRGGEVYRFPERSIIPAGESRVLACRSYNGSYDFEWSVSKAWHEDKSDKASLIDNYGNLIDTKKSK